MRLVDDWKQSWRWLSIRIAALALAFEAALLAMPDVAREWLPDWAQHGVAIFLLVALTLGRLYHQPLKDKDNA